MTYEQRKYRKSLRIPKQFLKSDRIRLIPTQEQLRYRKELSACKITRGNIIRNKTAA
jgi:hypothetical protein